MISSSVDTSEVPTLAPPPVEATDEQGGETDESIVVPVTGEAVPTYSVGDLVWLDSDRDGIQDIGEPGVESVLVSLLDANGAVVGHTSTDHDGHYTFAGVAGGMYRLELRLPDGHSMTPSANGDNRNDSDLTYLDEGRRTARTDTFDITSPDGAHDIDLGLVRVEVITPDPEPSSSIDTQPTTTEPDTTTTEPVTSTTEPPTTTVLATTTTTETTTTTQPAGPSASTEPTAPTTPLVTSADPPAVSTDEQVDTAD